MAQFLINYFNIPTLFLKRFWLGGNSLFFEGKVKSSQSRVINNIYIKLQYIAKSAQSSSDGSIEDFWCITGPRGDELENLIGADSRRTLSELT